MPNYPLDQPNIPKLKEIYQEVIGKISEEICKEFLNKAGKLDGDSEKIFKEKLKNLITHAHEPSLLLRIGNTIENHPRMIKAITEYVIPLPILAGTSYYFSRPLINAIDIALGEIIKVCNTILTPFDVDGSIQEETSAFHRDALKAVGSISTTLIFCFLYKMTPFTEAIARTSKAVIWTLKKSIDYIAGPNPLNILSEFNVPTEFQAKFAWILYSILSIHDDERNTDKRLKEIFTINKEDGEKLNKTRAWLHKKFHEAYQVLIKPHIVRYPEAFNDSGEAKDKTTFEIILKEHLETVILIPAYFFNKYHNDKYSDELIKFLEPINITKDVKQSREIEPLIEVITKFLGVINLHEKKYSAGNFNDLVEIFNTLFTIFCDSPSDRHYLLNHSLIFKSLKKLIDEIKKLSETDKENMEPNLIYLLNNISCLLVKFTNRLPNSSASECSNTSDKTLSKESELNTFLWNINDFLAIILNILWVKTENQMQRTWLMDNIYSSLEKFINILANTRSKQQDAQSGKDLNWNQLEKLQAHINNLSPIATKLTMLSDRLKEIIPRFKQTSVVIQMEMEIDNNTDTNNKVSFFQYFSKNEDTNLKDIIEPSYQST